MDGSSKKMRIALIQFEAVLGDVEGNVAKAVAQIAEAAANGADMVVLPELFSTGYHLDTVGPKMTEYAAMGETTIETLSAAARENGCYVVAGIAMLHGLAGVPFNSAVLIDRNGAVQGVFDKVHLWALERFYFRSGNEFPVFDTEFGKVGIIICYDLGFPEAARILALKGAELILCPSAWCAEDMDVWHTNVPCRALENTCFVAAVNRFGREGEDLYMPGHSMVCGPRGHRLAYAEEEAETILYADIDFDEVRTNRVTSPYLRDRRPDAYDDVVHW